MYHLLEHPNPHDNFYTSRRSDIRGIVIHTAESLPDFDGDDSAAERLADWASRTTRAVSWHASVDSDSTIPMLPDEYTAFHVRGYNSSTLGVEIATQARKWDEAPEEWVDGVLDQLAALVAGWCKAHGIPGQRITKAEYDAGGKGLLAHASLDPGRRTDPGGAFPWAELERRVGAILSPPPTKPKKKKATKKSTKKDWWEELMSDIGLVRRGDRGHTVRVVQDIVSLFGTSCNIDGVFGPETERAVKAAQAQVGVSVDGIVGPNTWRAWLTGKS